MIFNALKISTKTVLYTIVGFLLIAVLLAAILRTSYIQTKLAQYYAPKISKALGYPIEIDKVTIHFFDEATLEGVRVKDYQGYQMIDIDKLDLDFQIQNLALDTTQNQLDYVRLYRPKVVLVIDKNGDLNIDEFIRRINKLLAPPKPRPKNPHPSPFIIKEADIVDGVFTLNDESEPYLNNRKSFDHYHFTLHELEAHLNDFTLIRDTISFKTTLKGYDRFSDTRIKTLQTNFLISDTQMRFDKLLLKLNNSVVRNQIVMSFNSQKDFKKWNAKVRMRANFDSTVVSSDDLGRFVNDMYQFKDTYYLNGNFDGTVNKFRLSQFDLYFGKKSKLHGDFAFDGLPSIPKTQMNLRMNKSHVQVQDLANYIGKETVSSIQQFGHIIFDGNFVGTTSNFKTKGLLESELGKLDMDVSMLLQDNSARSSYSGSVKAKDFNLGKLIDQQNILGNLTLAGKIEGKGFSWNDAVLKFDGDVNQIDFNQYQYKNIYVNGQLAKKLFEGRVAVKDTNLIFDLFGKVDFRNNKDQIDLIGKLSKSNLRELNFTKDDWRFTTILDVQLKGYEIDKAIGKAKFYNTTIGFERRDLFLDSIRIVSEINPNHRRWALESEVANFAFSGDFKPSKAVRDLQQLVQEYKLYFTGDEKARQSYYAHKLSFTPMPYRIDYKFLLKDFYPVMALVYPEGKVAKNTQINGTFGISNTSTFSLESTIDTLLLGNKYQFYRSHIDLNSSKFYNTPEVLASLIISSKNQKISILQPTENLDLEASWDQDKIRFTSNIKQENATNQANLNGTLRFIQEGISLQFIRSKFRMLDQVWTINPENLISVMGKELSAQNLVVGNDDQFVSLNGKISTDSTEVMNFKAKNFSLETLAPIIAFNFGGIVNADVSLKEVYNHVNADSQLRIDGLTLDNFLIGNLEGTGMYDQEAQIVRIDYNLERLSNHVLKMRGTYDPKQQENSLNLTANLNQTSLQILEPFTKGLFSKLKGSASGDLNISGNLRHPIVNGTIDLKKGSLFFDYLKTTLNFEDKLVFEPDEIRAKSLRLTDEEGNKATLSGGVYYDGDKTFTLQLNANMNRFKILNTTRKDNDTYYGVGYASGRIGITGTPSNLNIDADIRSDRGTRLFIPLDKAQDAGNQEEIEFLAAQTKDSSATTTQKIETSDSRIKMDFKFDFNPDAYGEVQFDKQTGDIMRVNGTGKINLKVDTKGDFSMTGEYAIERGDYTFTFQNIINKKFTIQRGSRISWSGSPYDAILDIKAAYTQNVNYLGSVIDTSAQGSSTYKNRAEFTRRYPVDVIINLKDRLLQPNISFDLKLHDYPQNPEFNSGVTAFQNRIRTDEQELNRQVSNVLLLGQMVSNSAAAFASVNLVNNLMELASNQLSNVFSKIDQNLNVDLSLNGNGLNQDLINNLQLRFSYNFNDRFRITRSGGFTTALNQTNALSLIGDWSLEWFIKRDGSLRLKTYNRNVQTSILGSFNTQYQTFTSGGMSVLYSKSFNYLFPNKQKLKNAASLSDGQEKTNQIDFLSNP